MQEIIYTEGSRSDTTPEGIADYFSDLTGQAWHAAGDNEGRLVLSRHPIQWSDRIKLIDGDRRLRCTVRVDIWAGGMHNDATI